MSSSTVHGSEDSGTGTVRLPYLQPPLFSPGEISPTGTRTSCVGIPSSAVAPRLRQSFALDSAGTRELEAAGPQSRRERRRTVTQQQVEHSAESVITAAVGEGAESRRAPEGSRSRRVSTDSPSRREQRQGSSFHWTAGAHGSHAAQSESILSLLHESRSETRSENSDANTAAHSATNRMSTSYSQDGVTAAAAAAAAARHASRGSMHEPSSSSLYLSSMHPIRNHHHTLPRPISDMRLVDDGALAEVRSHAATSSPRISRRSTAAGDGTSLLLLSRQDSHSLVGLSATQPTSTRHTLLTHAPLLSPASTPHHPPQRPNASLARRAG